MILIDTHTLIWWINDDKTLSAPARNAIESEIPHGKILISTITTWEIALLVKRNRLLLNAEISAWLSLVERMPEVTFIPIDNAIALETINLPGEFHKDPADRFIVATARKYLAPIVTLDANIRAYPHVQTIW